MRPCFPFLQALLFLLSPPSGAAEDLGSWGTLASHPSPSSLPLTEFTSNFISGFGSGSRSRAAASASSGSGSSSVTQVSRSQSLRAAVIPFLLLFGDLNIISWMARPEHSKRFTTPFVNCRCQGNELKPG